MKQHIGIALPWGWDLDEPPQDADIRHGERVEEPDRIARFRNAARRTATAFISSEPEPIDCPAGSAAAAAAKPTGATQ